MRRGSVLGLAGLVVLLMAIGGLFLPQSEPPHTAQAKWVGAQASMPPGALVVNSTGDGSDANPGDGVCLTATAGECTARAAIQEANARAGADTIAFSIGSGAQSIAVGTNLPAISDAVTIDGTTQPGYAGSPIIELWGPNNCCTESGLDITAGNSTVRGLAINRFYNFGIQVRVNGGNRIEGSFIGTNLAGDNSFPGQPQAYGIVVQSGNNIVGGTAASAKNLISGHLNAGISIFGSGASGNSVQGNLIGTNAAGTASGGGLRNSDGISVSTGALNTNIGGTTAGSGNVVSGNQTGIYIYSAGAALGTLVQGNLIGVQVDGVSPLANTSHGVRISSSSGNVIGGLAPGAANVIANTGFYGGLNVQSGNGNAVLSNSIYSNTRLGIDLVANPFQHIIDGVTGNDPGDGDSGVNGAGGNELQNYPVLSSFTSEGGSTTVNGTLNSTANTTFTLQFFNDASCDESSHGEGQTLIGTSFATTDAGGNAAFSETFPASVPAAHFIAATATNPANNTSEFSQCLGSGGPVQTATPTASPSPCPSPPVSSPTPGPTPTPGPQFGSSVATICNDHDQAVSDLHIVLTHVAFSTNSVAVNAPGCPNPAYRWNGSSQIQPYTVIDIDWGTACVDPRETVTVWFGCDYDGCPPPTVSCFYWTLTGTPMSPCRPAFATPTPPPTPTPAPTPTATATPTPTPPLDGDSDGWSDGAEGMIGTNPLAACGTDAWPADINNDTFVDIIGDIAIVTNYFGQSVPPAPARYNLAPDPPDGFIDVIGDISRMAGLFGTSCAP